MTLIKSISGIRGTIGGVISENLTPIDVVKFTSAYAQWIKNTSKKSKIKIVIGRDARLSGEMVSNLVSGTLISMGVEVIDFKIGIAIGDKAFFPSDNSSNDTFFGKM